MLIRGRRIRSLERYLGPVDRRTSIVIALTDITGHRDAVEQAGFTTDAEVGDSVLPAPVFGPVSRFNANGKDDVHRDRPMETVYRTVIWRWTEWRGPYRQERERIVEVPYQRYPRTFIPPPAEELRIALSAEGNRIVVGPAIEYVEANDARLLHVINLFLEMFGECEVLTEHLEEIIGGPVRRLNWTVLPPGRRPWPQLRSELEPIVREAPEGNQQLIRYRLQVLNGFAPEFYAIGQAGFRGYVIFGYPERNLFVSESMYIGNATYVFDERWEQLSQMTKAEILNEDLQTDRIIHRSSWEAQVRRLLG
jgi:hypothetical protein